MSIILYIFFVLGVCGSIVGHPTKIGWRWISDPVFAVQYLEDPIGKEGNVYSYLCSAHRDGKWMAGKLRFTPAGIICYIALGGGEHRYGTFRMLEAPPGTLSWVSFTGNLPPHAIKEGYHQYVCRGWNNQRLIPGKYDSGDKRCYMPLGGKEISVTGAFEILVKNEYGLMINA